MTGKRFTSTAALMGRTVAKSQVAATALNAFTNPAMHQIAALGYRGVLNNSEIRSFIPPDMLNKNHHREQKQQHESNDSDWSKDRDFTMGKDAKSDWRKLLDNLTEEFIEIMKDEIKDEIYKQAIEETVDEIKEILSSDMSLGRKMTEIRKLCKEEINKMTDLPSNIRDKLLSNVLKVIDSDMVVKLAEKADEKLSHPVFDVTKYPIYLGAASTYISNLMTPTAEKNDAKPPNTLSIPRHDTQELREKISEASKIQVPGKSIVDSMAEKVNQNSQKGISEYLPNLTNATNTNHHRKHS